MKKNRNNEENKDRYQKPKLITIELAADEVLAVSCKNTDNTAAYTQGCTITPCYMEGS